MQIKVRITPKAYKKMGYFIRECDTEIAGLGKVREFVYPEKSDGEERLQMGFEIYDVEILPQIVSGGHADLNDEDMVKFITEKMKQGKNIREYRLWWHSHVNFSAFFSKTDTDTINGSTEFPFLISIVANKKGEMQARFDMFKPVRWAKVVNIEVLQDEDPRLLAHVRKEIKNKVKEETHEADQVYRGGEEIKYYCLAPDCYDTLPCKKHPVTRHEHRNYEGTSFARRNPASRTVGFAPAQKGFLPVEERDDEDIEEAFHREHPFHS